MDDYPEHMGDNDSSADEPYEDVYPNAYPEAFSSAPESLPDFLEDDTPTPKSVRAALPPKKKEPPKPPPPKKEYPPPPPKKEYPPPKKKEPPKPPPARKTATVPAAPMPAQSRLSRRLSLWRRKLIRIAVVLGIYALALYVVFHYVLKSEDDQPAPPTSTPVFVEGGGGWPSGLGAVKHTVPAMIQNVLSYYREQHGYEFQGKAGQEWYVEVEPTDGTLDPAFTLYAPSGDEIASADDRSADDLTAETSLVLPQDGPYRLLVRSSQGGQTVGSYLLIVCVPGRCP